MRAFISIDTSNEVKDFLAGIQQQFKEDVKASFTKKEQMHITLKFLGEVNSGLLKELEETLKNIQFKPFTLALEKIGVFPSENNIRVIWCGTKENPELMQLQKNIEEKLARFKKDHDFTSHITLARVKLINRKKQFIEKMKKIDIPKIEFKVNSFELMESILSSAAHKIVGKYEAKC